MLRGSILLTFRSSCDSCKSLGAIIDRSSKMNGGNLGRQVI